MDKKTKATDQLINLLDGMEEGVIFADKQDIIVEVNNNFLNLIEKKSWRSWVKKFGLFNQVRSQIKLRYLYEISKNISLPHRLNSNNRSSSWKQYFAYSHCIKIISTWG